MQAVEQGSLDWLEWRKQGIGGSDAPIILGFHDFGTPFQLWQEKLGLLKREPNQFIVDKGTRLEPKARAAYSLINDIDVPPALVQHPEIPWLKASLDGWNEKTRFNLEIKYTGKDAHEAVKFGIIPDKYKAQMQHQFAASRGESADFLSCIEVGEGENKQIEIATCPYHRDDIYIKKMLEVEAAFWDLVQNKIAPEFVEGDFKSVRGKGMKKLFEEYLKIRTQIEAMLPSDEPRMRFGEVRIFNSKGAFAFRVEKGAK